VKKIINLSEDCFSKILQQWIPIIDLVEEKPTSKTITIIDEIWIIWNKFRFIDTTGKNNNKSDFRK